MVPRFKHGLSPGSGHSPGDRATRNAAVLPVGKIPDLIVAVRDSAPERAGVAVAMDDLAGAADAAVNGYLGFATAARESQPLGRPDPETALVHRAHEGIAAGLRQGKVAEAWANAIASTRMPPAVTPSISAAERALGSAMTGAGDRVPSSSAIAAAARLAALLGPVLCIRAHRI